MKAILIYACFLILQCISLAEDSPHSLCLVPNCHLCSSTNFCGLCENNYMLSLDISGSLTYCQPVNCNISNCQTCFQDNICQVCSVGYNLTTDGDCQLGHQLNSCLANCSVCKGSVCLTCNFGFTYKDGVCSSIYGETILGCKSYFSQNSCQLCIDGYLVKSDGTCEKELEKMTFISQIFMQTQIQTIECSMSNCIYCISPNFCGQCSGNLSVSFQGAACYECNIPNCQTCDANNSCYLCYPGYEQTQTQQCGQCSILGCEYCVNSTYCYICNLQYENINGTCVLCFFPCMTCLNPSNPYQCFECFSPYLPMGYDFEICYTCSSPNCIQCSNNITFCQGCITNYVLQPDGTCILGPQCSIFCLACAGAGNCINCAPGYGIDLAGNSQCFLCNASNCITCSSSNASNCTACQISFYIVNGSCVPCAQTNCLQCNSTTCIFYQQNLNQQSADYNGLFFPVTPDPGCAYVSFFNPMACTECYAGKTLNPDRLCIPCVPPCLQCDATTPAICIACYPNAFLYQSTCVSCNQSSNCLTCTPANLSVCTSCPTGYLLNNITYVCNVSCPSFCLNCLTPNICSLCLTGYSKSINGQCLPCVSNCRICPDTNQGQCISCGYGFYVDVQGNCAPCSLFCYSCYNQGCLNCVPGYYLSQNSTCVPVCIPPCASCLLNSTLCTSCLLGYIYNSSNNSCTPQTSNCLNGACYYCPIGYINSGSPNYECIQCSPNAHCARCNPSNLSLCLTCINGYYLDSTTTTCTICPVPCATCIANNSCTSCYQGYFLPSQPIFNPQFCIQCQPPCALCYLYPNVCLTCIEGYSLNGWNCESNFNFVFSLELQVYQSQFYQNYGSLLYQIVGPLNNSNNIGAVTVISIQTQANSIITGTISTNEKSNTTEAVDQFDAIYYLFDSGKIANMPIKAFTLNASDGSIPPPPPIPPPVPPTPPTPPTPPANSNLGLILGICIPIIIIIIVISIFVYRKYKSQNNELIYTNQQLTTNFQNSIEQL